jgi:hypothetical protein
VPFAQLPACATLCGILYDANGACVPPVQTAVDTDCFCNYKSMTLWATQANGVCDGACPTATADLTRIQSWYQGFCGVNGAAAQPTSTGGSGGGKSSGAGGDW